MIALSLVILLGLMALTIPVVAVLGIIGLTLDQVYSMVPLVYGLGQVAWKVNTDFILVAIPLYILLGQLLLRSGIAERMYAALSQWFSWMPGGLMHSNIVSCAMFAAVSGSSAATAATIGTVAIAEIDKHEYNERLFLGSLASGGTLGILIPPSIALVIYGNLTESDIGKLFIAGILPGILGIALYVVAVAGVTAIRPHDGPRGERMAWRQRLVVLKGVWGILALFTLVMGGVYLGVFTPTEAAGIGAAGALLFALFRRALTLASLVEVLQETAQTTAALMIMIVGAVLFSSFMNLAGLPDAMAAFVAGLDVGPIGVMFVIVLIYVVLGCVFDAFAMILLTVPILAPLVVALGYDLIWFGIIVVVVAEIALITPPIGINVFVLKAILLDITDTTIFRGVVPFVLVDLIRVAVLVLAPGFVLFLPSFMD